MVTILIIIIIIGIILGIWGWSENKKEGLKSIGFYQGEFLGSFENIGYCNKMNLSVYEDRLRFTLTNNKKDIYLQRRDVFMNDIESFDLYTESQIVERVSLGKIICFGVLAFAMKGKQKRLMQEYVVIKAKCENETVDLVLDLDSNSSCTDLINDIEKAKSINQE